ncbi:MAG TPA: sugar ABC transporter permease [Anaerolineaceae bacterium]|nr:sugar ABC transporter permease [Anaerolineaceae bacterium]
MQPKIKAPKKSGRIMAGVLAFVAVVILIMSVAILNAPTKGGPKVMETMGTYLAEVKRTAIPFLVAVGVGAAIIGIIAAINVYRVWSNRKKRSTMQAAYSFLAPYILVTALFTVGVILFAFYISFNKYDIFTEPVWIGLDNYKKAFMGFTDSTQKDFVQALYNVGWYSLIVVPTQTALAIGLAVLLNSRIKMRNFFRTIFYAPSVTSSVVITLIFVWLYLKGGFLNGFLTRVLTPLGITYDPINWLGDPRGLFQLFGFEIKSAQWYLRGPSIAWMAIMFQNIFTTAPTFMIMFLAGLQDINPVLYEAAAIDGASGWQQFTKITLPLLRPIILLVIVLGTIGTLQVFDQVYLATQGGPLGTSLTPVYLIFREAMGSQGPINMGYASALAFILALIIFLLTFIQRRVLEHGTERY